MEEKTRTTEQLIDELKKSRQRINRLEKEVAKSKKYEILLREIHHRVRNNMQIVSSLLRLQSRKIDDKKLFELLKVCQNRIQSMALIHEKLYLSKDLAKIDLDPYIQDLAFHLFHSHGVDPDIIKLVTGMESVHLEVNKAVPFGLIVNELITNSLKHAFPNGKRGEILITLHPINQKKLEFTVSDNGIGLPKDLNFRNTHSLGMKLITNLVDQLNGSIEFQREKGTSCKITF